MIDPAGMIVSSRCGRDRGRSFVVIGKLDEDHVLIADGDTRKTEKPKKKKLKHLCFSKETVDLRDMPSKESGAANAFIRQELAAKSRKTPSETKEG